MVTGDSQEEVLIFRDRHCIIIYISSSLSSSSSSSSSHHLTVLDRSAQCSHSNLCRDHHRRHYHHFQHRYRYDKHNIILLSLRGQPSHICMQIFIATLFILIVIVITIILIAMIIVVVVSHHGFAIESLNRQVLRCCCCSPRF